MVDGTPPLRFWYVAVYRNDFTFSWKPLILLTRWGLFYGWWRCWRPVTSQQCSPSWPPSWIDGRLRWIFGINTDDVIHLIKKELCHSLFSVGKEQVTPEYSSGWRHQKILRSLSIIRKVISCPYLVIMMSYFFRYNDTIVYFNYVGHILIWVWCHCLYYFKYDFIYGSVIFSEKRGIEHSLKVIELDHHRMMTRTFWVSVCLSLS